MDKTFRFKLDFQMNLFHEDGIFLPHSKILSHYFKHFSMRKCVCIIEDVLVQKQPALKEMILDKLKGLSNHFETPPVLIERSGGESQKTLENALEMCKVFEQQKMCRHSVVIVIGGGAFLDVVGFACSLTHRGLRLIRVPTTTLSQADSGVGVKNGVNAFDKKNFLGCFQPPVAVFNDSTFLETLSDNAWRDGIPEAMKVAMIKDADFFDELIAQKQPLFERNMNAMKYLICKSADLHIHHILCGGDPFENGSARPLDFGHWIAHKLEAMSNYSLSHGAAVAIGVVIDAHQAYQRGLLKLEFVEKVRDFFEYIGFNLKTPLLNDFDQILAGIEEFREHLGGRLQITLPNGVGARVEVDSLERGQVLAAINYVLTP